MKNKFYLLLIPFVLSACFTRKTTVSDNQYQKNNQQIQKANPGASSATSLTSLQYIDRYKAIAIQEMKMYGIPASITLAQGLFESGSGNSQLARVANNHFGIKCTSDWLGRSYFKDDDHVNDCFRVYDRPEDSFRDHSLFLKRKNYAALYQLDKNDYQGWAYGLKKAGYATNPNYPTLLINIIQKYHLDQYDTPAATPLKSVVITQPQTAEQNGDTVYLQTPPNSVVLKPNLPQKKVDTVYIQTPPKSMAVKPVVPVTRVDTVYIQMPAKTVTAKPLVPIKKIDTVYIQGPPKKVVVKPAIPVKKRDTVYIQMPNRSAVVAKADTVQSNNVDNLYTVSQGDTLYNISKRFGLTVDDLKALNNLTDNNIKIGQKLIVK